MAKPFFSGDYGSALAKVDTRPIVEAGRAQGQMLSNLGSQIGGMIKQYGLNKEKQSKLTDKIENRLKLDPSIAQRLTMTGDEDFDKKNVTDMEKLTSGELGLKGLQRLDSAMATINEVNLQKQAEEDREMKKSAFKLSQLTQQLSNDNTRLRNQIAELTKDDVVEATGADARAKKSKANMLETDEAYQKDVINKDLENKQSLIDYRQGVIEYQDLQKKRLQNSDTNGLSSSNSDRYREISKQIDGIMDNFATVVDGEKLTIEDMIENITDSGEIILREDISVRAESSIPRLEDLLKEKHELNQSRILQNVPMSDGSRRNMTQAEFNIMLQKDREKEEQAQLLKQAELQAGSASNLKPPTMFK